MPTASNNWTACGERNVCPLAFLFAKLGHDKGFRRGEREDRLLRLVRYVSNGDVLKERAYRLFKVEGSADKDYTEASYLSEGVRYDVKVRVVECGCSVAGKHDEAFGEFELLSRGCSLFLRECRQDLANSVPHWRIDELGAAEVVVSLFKELFYSWRRTQYEVRKVE